MDFLLRVPKENELSFKIEYISKLESINPQNGVLYVEKLDHLDYNEENIRTGTKVFIAEDIINYKFNNERENNFFIYNLIELK